MIRLLTFVYLLVFSSVAVGADPYAETRYCGAPKRDAAGKIMRSASVIAAFRKLHPCPSTGLKTGPCAGWSVDHVLPLSEGFCDFVSNLQWLPNILKSGSGMYPKDRWERKINGTPEMVCRAIADSNIHFDQLIMEFANPDGRGWTHIGIGAKSRQQILTINQHGVV